MFLVLNVLLVPFYFCWKDGLMADMLFYRFRFNREEKREKVEVALHSVVHSAALRYPLLWDELKGLTRSTR